MTVAESLKRFRKELKVTQNEVAEKLGMMPQAYYRYETGKYSPRANDIVLLAKAYNVSTDYLLGLTDEPRPKPADKVLVEAIKNCRDSIQKVLAEVDKVTSK